jgi:hypothetical protein
VANLFNQHPGLEPPTEEVDIEGIQETREEKVKIGLALDLIHLPILHNSCFLFLSLLLNL